MKTEVKKFKKQKATEYNKNKHVYVGRNVEKFFIGGPYYSGYAQIHLNDEDFADLFRLMKKHIKLIKERTK